MRCPSCRGERWELATTPHARTIAGVVFTADLPGDRCAGCGEVLVEHLTLRAFNRKIAATLLERGLASPEAFQFIRKTTRLAANELANLLDVSAVTVSHWETGKHPVPRAVWALLGVVLADEDAGHTQTLDRLRAALAPQREPREVRFDVPLVRPADASLSRAS